MNADTLVFPIVCFAFGLTIGGVIVYLRYARRGAEAITSETRLKMLEGTAAELRQQIEQRDHMLMSLRTTLEGAQQDRAIADTRLTESIRQIEEQKRFIAEAQDRLTNTFKALSGESLQSNNQAFMDLARKSLEVVLAEAKGDFGKREEAIRGAVKPLEDALKRYEVRANDLEQSRTHAYANLETQIESLLRSQQDLQKETGNLVSALRRPEVRGRWGEITLKRVVELSGMSEHCDYHEQVSAASADGKIRPDMVVHLPAGRQIVIDSKVSLDAYLDAIATEDGKKRIELLSKHAHQLRRHMKSLSEKGYWDQFPLAPEFVVMFIPGDSFLSAAVEHDPALIEDGMRARVIIATPTTLIALLRAIAYGWRQEQIAQHAQEIADLGRELYERFQPFLEHLGRTGTYLSQVVGSYNKMVNSLEHRVLVSIRKFKELGATGDKEIPEVQSIEQLPIKILSDDPDKMKDA